MIEFKEFLEKNKDTVFRWYKYKKVWTPHELDKKYSDESVFENGGYANIGCIREAIILPDKDVLLKIETVTPPEDISLYSEEELEENQKVFEYVKLSEIVLEEFEKDN